MSNELNQAALDVLAERQRQISAEGWTPEHDDDHDDGSLGKAAAVYAISFPGFPTDMTYWPWPREAFKPKDRRQNLVRAAALLIAEIDRLDRQWSRSRP